MILRELKMVLTYAHLHGITAGHRRISYYAHGLTIGEKEYLDKDKAIRRIDQCARSAARRNNKNDHANV